MERQTLHATTDKRNLNYHWYLFELKEKKRSGIMTLTKLRKTDEGVDHQERLMSKDGKKEGKQRDIWLEVEKGQRLERSTSTLD